MVYTSYYSSPVGRLMLASDGEGLCGLWSEGQKYYAATLSGEVREDPAQPVFAAATDWLDRYFAGEKPPASELRLTPHGSDFRKAVWEQLLAIPYGGTTTYGDIAKKISAGGMSAQAVGGAVGHNPISIIIPCHRVVGANCSLTGYAGGLAAKQWLLAHEGAAL